MKRIREIPSFVYDPSCVLYLPLWKRDAKDGDSFISDDAYGHLCTVTGATHGMQGRTFTSANPDYINCGTSASLDFTTSSFTIIIWFNCTDLSGNPNLFNKGNHQSNGYFFRLFSAGSGQATFYTSQSGVAQQTDATGAAEINKWIHLAAVRSGASVRIYRDAVDITSGAVSHINPDSGAAVPALIGIHQNLVAEPFAGVIGEVSVFSRDFAVSELRQNLNVTKWRYT